MVRIDFQRTKDNRGAKIVPATVRNAVCGVCVSNKAQGKSIVSEALNTVYGGGTVIGSFVCDKVYKIVPDGEYYSNGYDIDDDMLSETCLGRGYLTGYGLGYTLYGWHITAPTLFDKPRELSEFGIARAPMSWCYVEELQ